MQVAFDAPPGLVGRGDDPGTGSGELGVAASRPGFRVRDGAASEQVHPHAQATQSRLLDALLRTGAAEKLHRVTVQQAVAYRR
jgi:hypothetical protein